MCAGKTSLWSNSHEFGVGDKMDKMHRIRAAPLKDHLQKLFIIIPFKQTDRKEILYGTLIKSPHGTKRKKKDKWARMWHISMCLLYKLVNVCPIMEFSDVSQSPLKMTET